MISTNLKNISNFCKSKLLNEKFANIVIEGVSIDSRKIEKNNLFIPIIGENFDGHDYINDAISNGASACLWSKENPIPDINFPIILVDDTLDALQNLAKNYRQSLNVKIIGITGSNGKTTTKDIVDSVLSQKYKTFKTPGNLNNHIGLPLTLLKLNDTTDIGIIEMGTDGFGQIEDLTNIAKPDIAVITNVSESHLDLLKTVDNVAHAKLEILKGLKDNGIFIYNGDDKVLSNIYKNYYSTNKSYTFGNKKECDYSMKIVNRDNLSITFEYIDKFEEYIFKLPLMGTHNVYNAMIAIIIAKFFNISNRDIQNGFNNLDMTGMRNEIIKLGKFTIINDAYKASPANLLAALDNLYNIKGYKNKVVVLGDMLDLGEKIISYHEEIGHNIDMNEIDQLYTIGEYAYYISKHLRTKFPNKVFHCDSKNDLTNKILDNIPENSIVLFKASRAIKLEDVIYNIKKKAD